MLMGKDFPILLDLIQESRTRLCEVATRTEARETSAPFELETPEIAQLGVVVLQSVTPTLANQSWV